jgi:hypothetical protein
MAGVSERVVKVEPADGGYLKGCPIEVWDGPYLYQCRLGNSVLKCAYHGPFERVKRCTKEPGCRRPVEHGGACC